MRSTISKLDELRKLAAPLESTPETRIARLQKAADHAERFLATLPDRAVYATAGPREDAMAAFAIQASPESFDNTLQTLNEHVDGIGHNGYGCCRSSGQNCRYRHRVLRLDARRCRIRWRLCAVRRRAATVKRACSIRFLDSRPAQGILSALWYRGRTGARRAETLRCLSRARHLHAGRGRRHGLVALRLLRRLSRVVSLFVWLY